MINKLIRSSRKSWRKKLQMKLLIYLLIDRLDYQRNQKFRKRNEIRERLSVLQSIQQKTDAWFLKSYRLPRPVFYSILDKIKPILETKNKKYAINSSGSTLIPEILLAATLRYLAGASYIDIVDHYKLPPTSFHTYIWRTIDAIDQVVNNINLPSNSNEWRKLSDEWNKKLELKFGTCLLSGTCLAIDGIVIETRQPTIEECNGDVTSNYNRKGFFGLVALSAVDVWGKFVYSELSWSGSTNDSTAFRCSELAYKIDHGELPDELHIVADEAYCASSPQVLTPFSKRSLVKLGGDNDEYSLRRSFNYILSFQRSTVERAFGMLVRKFLLLGRRFEIARERVPQIFKVCCKLHNLSIDHWISTTNPTLRQNYTMIREKETENLTDNHLVYQIENYNGLIYQPRDTNIDSQATRRMEKANSIWRNGFRYDKKN